MAKPHAYRLGPNVERMSFSRIDEIFDMPNLIDVQKQSYQWFLDKGLREVLADVSPVKSTNSNLVIEFVDYRMNEPTKYSEDECKERDANYAAPLRVTVRLLNQSTGEVSEKEMFMGDFPLMTDNGTFIINGAERVIVSQLVRSPGAYYEITKDQKSGKRAFATTVIPYRGAWLEYDSDASDVFNVRIDKNRRIPITVLIRALGIYRDEEIIRMFGDDVRMINTMQKDGMQAEAEKNGTTAEEEALKEIYKKIRPGEPPLVDSARLLLHNLFFDPKRYDLAAVGRYKYNKKFGMAARLVGQTLSEPAVDARTGEIVAEADTKLDAELAQKIEDCGINRVIVKLPHGETLPVFANDTVDPALYFGIDLEAAGIAGKVCRGVMQEIVEACAGDVEQIVATAKERVAELTPKHITKEDILASINYLVGLTHEIGTGDDIDHLGNRRLRCVGELLQNQLRIGFAHMEKNIRERMDANNSETVTPDTLVNIRPIISAVREFFGSSQLSQFMDQNNPLAELTHKRRLSALGPGGLSRERASFAVRDVHYTHYGRMCPIETPEGQNIGLISYLSTYARINPFGFIEAPYRRVLKDEQGRSYVSRDVDYMTADVEDNYIIAQANEPIDENGYFKNKKVSGRCRAEIAEFDANEVDYMDVSPKMVVSVATASIPFLENDDNARALMGSNMQKQAVPLMVTESPIVATGMEYKAAVDSGVVVLAKEAGTVERVCSDEIVICDEQGKKETYHLIKFKRSNQGTCINQRPIVKVGDTVEKGQVIADGPATAGGEISLGKNALIGFMTWEGYNYEDAVLLNERLVRDDVYTSIHIEEYSCEARMTKLGAEEITNEIPNVGDDALKNLDAMGVVRRGTEVRAGDILIGKVTPKGETDLTAEERLLRAIFGEKSREVRDTSTRLPHGESGIVVDVRVFSRENSDDLAPGVNKVVRVYVAQKRKISVGDKMAGRHGNKGVVSRILPPEDMPFLPDGTPLDIVLNPLGVPSRMNIGQVLEVHLGIAAKKLGWKIMTPVFDGAKESDIAECLKEANYGINENGEADGKTVLYDGRTGEPFANRVTVGIMYYLKLHHLVDDKIHARSVGPYSLVTQQPLGGKAQFGGQRFGEMEVWALEAYGAAYTLQEILTVKSDDVNGRTKTYEAIVKGQNLQTPGVPESFKVLVKELQSLALDIRVLDKNGEQIELATLGDDDSDIRYVDPNEVGPIVEDGLDGFSVEDEDGNPIEDEFDDEFEDSFDDLDPTADDLMDE